MYSNLTSYILLANRTKKDESYDDWLKDVKKLSMHYNDDLTDYQRQILETLYNCYYTTHYGAMYLLEYYNKSRI